MAITDRFDTFRLGGEGASVCATFWERDGASAALAEAVRLWGQPLRSTTFLAGNNYPPACFLEYPTVVVAVFGGAMTSRHIAAFVAGMGQGGLLGSRTADLNKACMEMVDQLPAFYTTVGLTKAKPQLLIGHSMGGACALLFGLGMVAQGGWGVPQMITFGSPKPGSAATAQAAQNLQVQRWMMQGDPVPRIWPAREESLYLRVVTPWDIALAGYGTAQWHGGTELRDNGTYRATLYPTPVPGDFSAELVSWWWRISGETSHPHHATTYARKLTDIATVIDALLQPPPPRDNVAELLPPRPSANDLRFQRLADIGEFVDAPLEEPAHGFAPAAKIWRYAKEEEVYNVYCLDKLVCTYKKRGLAKKLVSGGNKAFGAYLRAPLGDSDQMALAVENFLAIMDQEGTV